LFVSAVVFSATAIRRTYSAPFAAPSTAAECADWQARHPEWIFCDDFEDDTPLVRQGRYFEHWDNGGEFAVMDGMGVDGSRGIRALWQPGEVEAGNIKLGFGRNPVGYMRKGIRPGEDFRAVWYRMYLRHQPGWEGNPAKLSRAMIFASAADWSQAMVAHLWGGRNNRLLIDPVRCIDADSRVKCSGYNDFAHMDWLGNQDGVTPIFDTANGGRWFCVEAHVRLNDPGRSNGVQAFWLDGRSEVMREGLDFVRSYRDYGINAVFFENYWNDGSPKTQWRAFDNIVVSTAPIGCLAVGAATPSPTPTATLPRSPTTMPTATPSRSPATPTAIPSRSPTTTPASWAYLPFAGLRLHFDN